MPVCSHCQSYFAAVVISSSGDWDFGLRALLSVSACWRFYPCVGALDPCFLRICLQMDPDTSGQHLDYGTAGTLESNRLLYVFTFIGVYVSTV